MACPGPDPSHFFIGPCSVPSTELLGGTGEFKNPRCRYLRVEVCVRQCSGTWVVESGGHRQCLSWYRRRHKAGVAPLIWNMTFLLEMSCHSSDSQQTLQICTRPCAREEVDGTLPVALTSGPGGSQPGRGDRQYWILPLCGSMLGWGSSRKHFSQFGGSQRIKKLPGLKGKIMSGGQVRLWEGERREPSGRVFGE